MVLSSVILDEGMVYFDARLAQHYPTVEIRAADVCFTVDEAIVVAALCRGLVETAAQEWAAGTQAPDVPTQMLRLATWQAGREGLEGNLLDWRTGLPDAVLVGARGRSSTTWARPCRRPGTSIVVQEGLARVREEGNGAIRQRAMFARTGRLVDVVAESVRETSSRVAG